MEIEYRRNLQHSYLVVRSREKEEESYSSKMITENRIPGLLVCEEKNIDDEVLYYYDLTSKISLADRWRGGKADGEEVLSMIYAFLRTVENMEEYLLSTDSIYLKLEQIYGDADMEEIEFCYIPGEKWDLEQQFRELLEEILPLLDHKNQKAVVNIYGIYHYIVIEFCYIPGEKWDLEQQFRELLEEILPLLDHKNQKAVVNIYGIYHYIVHDGVSAEGLREHIEKYEKKGKTAEPEDIYRGKKFVYGDGEYSRDQAKSDDYERQREQKKHEEALEAFFQEDETEEKEKDPIWITYIAAGIFLYFLSGWFLWKNFSDGIWIWLGFGGVMGTVLLFWSIIYKKKKRRQEETEVRAEGEKENTQSYAQGWEKEITFQEEEYMTRILGNHGEREGVFLEEKYPRQDRRIVLEKKKEITFQEEEYMTRILGNHGEREGVFLEEKYPRQDRRIVLEKKEMQFLGTLTEKADILLPSQAVSRLHGRIRMEGKHCYLRDMNSRNGTWVNGKILEGEQEIELEEGDEIVSRLHGRIRMEGKHCYLRDMNSRNGTWVNGKILEGEQEIELEEGDEIQFADLIYRFHG